jgi:hypothetical protein
VSRKILRRCSLCKKFHAAYLVEDPELGEIILCYSCWKARKTQEAVQTLIEPPGDGNRIQHPVPDKN